MPAVQTSYLRPGFPVLAFSYALYCDAEFSETEHAAWWNAKPEDYRGYLDLYKLDPLSVFPAGAEKIIAEDVPHNPDERLHRHRPTREQAWELMPFLIDEICNRPREAPTTPSTPAGVDRSPAVPNPERPLLACLACIFLNQDRRFRENIQDFLADFGLCEESAATLTAFSKGGANYMTLGQALSLTTALVDELIKQPATW